MISERKECLNMRRREEKDEGALIVRTAAGARNKVFYLTPMTMRYE